MRLLSLAILCTCCCTLLRAEVIERNGQDYLLLPPDLVLGWGMDNITMAVPYTIGKDGHAHLSKMYRRVYKFDKATLRQIDAALLKLEQHYFQFLHEHAEISKTAENDIIFMVSNAKDGMAAAMDEFSKTINGLLDDEQTLDLKYFDILHFSKDGARSEHGIITTNERLGIKLTFPRPLINPEHIEDPQQKKIIELQNEYAAAVVRARSGRGSIKKNNDNYSRVLNKLKKFGIEPKYEGDYWIDYGPEESLGEPGRGQRRDSESGDFLFYSRAYSFHTSGKIDSF